MPVYVVTDVHPPADKESFRVMPSLCFLYTPVEQLHVISH